MQTNIQEITKNLADKEKTSGIIWIVIGAIQVLTCAACIAGAWNIYAGISRLKQAKAVENPWPTIVADYDKWQTNIIICLVINLIFGGVIGAAGCIFDFMTRSYVLDNKAVFEEYFNSRA